MLKRAGRGQSEGEGGRAGSTKALFGRWYHLTGTVFYRRRSVLPPSVVFVLKPPPWPVALPDLLFPSDSRTITPESRQRFCVLRCDVPVRMLGIVDQHRLGLHPHA